MSYNSRYAKAQRSYVAARRELDNGNIENSRKAFRRTLSWQPHAATIYAWLGLLSEAEGDHEGAVEHFATYLQAHPDNSEVNYFYATSLLNSGNHEEALKVLQSLPRETKQQVEVINATATCFLALNQPEMALAVLDKGPVRAKKLDPTILCFRYLLGKTCAMVGKKRRAITHLSRVYAEDIKYADVKELLTELGALDSLN